ncbi:hypothetical protein N657DRAFT_678724 [Parathielavia appendiculata]|uniref:Uncharacterized protein n=1 Tax=Parathielavia appendiculata TaxID=2587402 RepID=A0AAN6U3S7_9PEZI|nr:hypothetical protein N657DRAFT_678724 [Parathielavia appendiculata]
MDTRSSFQRCAPANLNDLKPATADTSNIFFHFSHYISSQPSRVNSLNPSHQDILATMSSNNSGNSSRNWDDILKHGSALSILKPDVAFSGTSSGSTSGSTSGGPSGGSSGGSTYPSGGQTSGSTTQR